MRRHTGSRTVSAASFTNRSGLSLLEIIISVAIFMASLAAIMEGLQIGRRSELSARLQSEAVLRCETVMGEILSGVKEAASAQGNPFDDDESGNWEWSASGLRIGRSPPPHAEETMMILLLHGSSSTTFPAFQKGAKRKH